MATLNPPIRDWRDQRVWIVGASTGIGASLAAALAARGAHVALSARREDLLQELRARLPAGEHVVLPVDVTDATAVARAESYLAARWPAYDRVIVMAGDYRPIDAWQFDLAAAKSLLDVNLVGPLHVLHAVLPRLRARGRGGVALVSSVAGYRGLPRSLAYGPGKAALINLAESLYFDLHPLGLAVHVVNPGFVRTPLTAQNDFEMPALMAAEEAAAEIVTGLARGDFEIHFPRRFTRLMKLLRWLPYRWYFPLVARRTHR
ncbi:MAG: SDR family NAD(P)-dependent oxidoreductase [Gammaproteobacteria bacterium]